MVTFKRTKTHQKRSYIKKDMKQSKYRTNKNACTSFGLPNAFHASYLYSSCPYIVGRKRGGSYFDHGLKKLLPKMLCNFFNIDPFLMIFAPFESCHRELSNGAKIIKNRSILKKLQSISGKRFFRPWPK